MAVRIRLTRVGATKRPSYRVVAIDSRRARDGRALEILGYYDPLTDPATVQIDGDRLKAWMANGATPSETVLRLMRQTGLAEPRQASASSRPPRPPRKAKATAESPAAPAAAPTAEAPAEAEAPVAEAPEESTDEAEPAAAEPAAEATVAEEAEPAAEPTAADETDAEADGESEEKA